MSEATEELERRAIELYTDLNEVVKATPEGIDKEFLGIAPPHHRERCCSRPPLTCSRHSTTLSTR